MLGLDFLQNHFLQRKFMNTYKCYSSSFGALSDTKSEDVKKGGKILMPPSALDQLTRLHITYPMMFKLTNVKMNNYQTHCGVLEFVADEGVVYLPYWMMQNLLLNEGDQLHVENCTLPIATYAKFQPQSPLFLEISNPKAVLENALRNFSCLTKGDIVAIHYNNTQYDLCVKELKPADAVSIVECDLNLDFETPIGYECPKNVPQVKESEEMAMGSYENRQQMEEYMKNQMSFSAFSGTGYRLDGKKKYLKGDTSEVDLKCVPRGVPNLNWKFGKLAFIRNGPPTSKVEENDEPSFEAFKGEGKVLRKRRN